MQWALSRIGFATTQLPTFRFLMEAIVTGAQALLVLGDGRAFLMASISALLAARARRQARITLPSACEHIAC